MLAGERRAAGLDATVHDEDPVAFVAKVPREKEVKRPPSGHKRRSLAVRVRWREHLVQLAVVVAVMHGAIHEQFDRHHGVCTGHEVQPAHRVLDRAKHGAVLPAVDRVVFDVQNGPALGLGLGALRHVQVHLVSCITRPRKIKTKRR